MNDTLPEPVFPVLPTLAAIEALEARVLALPPDCQVEVPCAHYFSPGLYIREMAAEAGTFLIGHEHLTEHHNILLEGAMIVLKDGRETLIEAPLIFVSPAHTRKVAFVVRAVRFLNLFPLAGLEACGHDVAKLEEALRVKSASFQAHELKQLEKGETP